MRFALTLFFVLLAMAGSFLAGNYLSTSSGKIEQVTAPQILEHAKKQVPAPVLPPKPGGREVTTVERKNVKVQTPHTVMDSITIGGIFKTQVPRIEMRTVEVVQDIPTTKLVDAAPDEISKWNAEVGQIQSDYEKKVQAKAKEIAEEIQKNNLSETMTTFKDIMTTMIIPFITAISGLIGAMATFRSASNRKSNGNTNK